MLTNVPARFPVRNTTVRIGASHAATVEHALSALAGLGITDAVMELDAEEVPILDGSAGRFAEVLEPLLVDIQGRLEPIRLTRAIVVREGEAVITAEPWPELSYTYALDYGKGSPIPPHCAAWHGDAADYAANIAPSRTFSLVREVTAARGAGLFAGFTAQELLVIDDSGQPIENQWRWPDEPAKHKLLDLIGDLSLLGRPLHARVVAERSGHALTHALCREILAMAGGTRRS